jgi:DNA-binding response OmpR family regulator
MPGMDGMEFIRRLGEAKVPVSIIILSASGSSLIASAKSIAEAYGISLLGTLDNPPHARKLEALIDALSSARANPTH